MRSTRHLRGFTIVEFTLVVAISAILVVGLGAIVEVPRIMLERDQDNASPSRAGRLLARIEQDILFAADIRVPNKNRLEVDLEDHTTAIYEWDGVDGGVVTLTTAGGTTTILTSVQQLRFALGTTPIDLKIKDHPVTTTSVVTSSFVNFILEPGYQLETQTLLPGMEKVNLDVRDRHVCADHRLGIAFRASGLSQPATPGSIQIRPVRNKTANLLIRLYEALPADPLQPNRARLIASTKILNSALPSVYTDLDVPLLAHEKLQPGQPYFFEFLGDKGRTAACLLQAEVIGDPDAVAPSDTGLVISGNSGATYKPAGAQLWLGQTHFTQQATETKVTVLTTAVQKIQIPTTVHLKLRMKSKGADQRNVTISFPCQNNVTLVNQQ